MAVVTPVPHPTSTTSLFVPIRACERVEHGAIDRLVV
jgi:hypothetical protein